MVQAGLALGLVFAAEPAAGAGLALRFEGLAPGGQISVAVFDGEASWRRRSNARLTLSRPVDRSSLEIRVDLPPGVYGVMAYHDRDGDGRLDTLPVGLPTEPYGFSNNSRGTFGPPAWRAAAFPLPAAGARLAIKLR